MAKCKALVGLAVKGLTIGVHNKAAFVHFGKQDA